METADNCDPAACSMHIDAFMRRALAAEAALATARDDALEKALSVERPDISRRYGTNDEAFFNEGFDAAIAAIRALKGGAA